MLRYELNPPRGTLVVDDPERRNPLSVATIEALVSAVERAASDPAVRVIVVTGAGDRIFSAGGDLAGGFVDAPVQLHVARGAFARLLRAMRAAGKPIVARVNGHALAGGFGLAAACDVVVAVEGARFGMPEVDVGLWPMMITAVLQRCMPHRAALELMMTGRLMEAEEARRLGVVSRVVAAQDLDTVVDEMVGTLAAKSPILLGFGRSTFYAVEDIGFDAALDYLQTGLTAVAMTEDAAEGVRAFLEKRDPEWSGT